MAKSTILADFGVIKAKTVGFSLKPDQNLTKFGQTWSLTRYPRVKTSSQMISPGGSGVEDQI